MKLSAKCGVCSSWTWCGRKCRHAPDAIMPDRQCPELLTVAPPKKTAAHDLDCMWCGRAFKGTLAAKYCSSRCRVNFWRASQGEKIRQSIPGSIRFDVMSRDKFRCVYCGKNANAGAVLEIDHVKPVARGGSNHMSNLVTACRECNSAKSDQVLAITTEELLTPTGI